MDVSSIKQLPKGRKPIITTWAKHEQYDKVFDANDLRVEKVVKHMSFALIESSEHLEDVQNVVALYESLQQYYDVSRVGLLLSYLPMKR